MKKDPFLYLDHIIESIEALEEYSENLSKDDLLNSLMIQDAICRRLEIIGEAANKLDDEFKENIRMSPGIKSWGCAICLSTNIFMSILIKYGTQFKKVSQNSKNRSWKCIDRQNTQPSFRKFTHCQTG